MNEQAIEKRGTSDNLNSLVGGPFELITERPLGFTRQYITAKGQGVKWEIKHLAINPIEAQHFVDWCNKAFLALSNGIVSGGALND